MAFKKATKFESKLRMALAGPSGSGKTYTALTLAHALADGKGVAVIDTERGSASKYADVFPEYDVAELDSFHPNNYIKAIREAEEAGYAVLVIDSLSHAWNGPGGLLELVEAITKRSNNKSSFNAWGEATPLQNKLIDSITRSKMHIICTMRTKTEYVIEQNERGKSAPRKVGTAPVQRADVEYEFDVYADLDVDNTLIVHKSRCSALAGAVISKPDASVAETLKVWLQGAPAPVPPAPPALRNLQPSQQPAAPAPQQSEPTEEQAQAVATAQQKSSIQKLCDAVSMSVPEDLDTMSFIEAKALIQQLTAEYKQQRAESNQSQPAPAQPKITPQQAERIRNLCKALGENEPEGLAGMAYFDAKTVYESLSARYKAQKATPPAATSDAPIQDKATPAMVNKAKSRAEAIDMLWGDIKRDALGNQVDDKDITVAQYARISSVIETYEQKKAS